MHPLHLVYGLVCTLGPGIFFVLRHRRKIRLAALQASKQAALLSAPVREQPLISQLLEKLNVQYDKCNDDCLICNHTMQRIRRLCGTELKVKVDICRTCLKGKCGDAAKLLTCHQALQHAIDVTRASYEEDLKKVQERLVLAEASLADTEAHRLFPDHRSKLEQTHRDILDATRRTQGWIDALACNVVERTATRLADEWRAKHRPEPIDRGPYRSLPGALAEEPVLASNS